MPDLGDRAEDSTIDFTFHTTSTAAVPTTLAGTPAISVYKANGTTQSTAGITLTVDFDTVTGLNHVRIDTSADAFYATGNDYSIVITTGTVDSVSVVGATVGVFSIENRRDPLTTQMTESYAADGVAPTLTQALFLIQQVLTEFGISGTTNTVKKIDGSTTAATFTLDDGTNPTSLTRAT